jgi:two-component system, NarL family, sensor histidine kinase DegS
MPARKPARKRVRRVRQPSDRYTGPAADEVRRVLARELHDSVAQTLSTMLLELQEFRAEQYGRAGVLRQLDILERSTREALSELRGLLVELRGQPSGDGDLVKLIREGLELRQGQRRPLVFELSVSPDWPARIPARVAVELHRVVEEAIENGVRHGGAERIEIDLNVSRSDQMAVLTIIDDGRGLPSQEGYDPGLGIVGMLERAHLLGGELKIEGTPAGRGTTVRVSVPVAAVVAEQDLTIQGHR